MFNSSEDALFCSGHGMAAVVNGMGLPHKEKTFSSEAVCKNWEKRASNSQLGYDLNKKIKHFENIADSYIT